MHFLWGNQVAGVYDQSLNCDTLPFELVLFEARVPYMTHCNPRGRVEGFAYGRNASKEGIHSHGDDPKEQYGDEELRRSPSKACVQCQWEIWKIRPSIMVLTCHPIYDQVEDDDLYVDNG